MKITVTVEHETSGTQFDANSTWTLERDVDVTGYVRDEIANLAEEIIAKAGVNLGTMIANG
jgi:hypothetical protein